MRYFNYAGLSPTRVEAVEEMQAVFQRISRQIIL